MKIPPKKLVRSYELTYVIPGNRTSVQISEIAEAVKALAKKNKATVLKEEDWGKRDLAYAIRHEGENQREGFYHHLVIDVSPDKIAELDRGLNLHQGIMRHLLVLAEEDTEDVEPVESEEESE